MRKIVIHSLLLLACAVGGLNFAYATIIKADNPKDFADRVANRIVEIIDSKQSDDRKQDQLIELFSKNVDTKWMSQFVLAKYYRQLDDKQKSKYADLYRDFVVYTYIPRFREYSGEKIRFYDVIDQDDEFIVKSALKTSKAKGDVLVDYRLKKNGNGYKITDIIGEGVSLITTQRSDFGAAISKKGIDNFMAKLESRVKYLKNNSPTK